MNKRKDEINPEMAENVRIILLKRRKEKNKKSINNNNIRRVLLKNILMIN